MAQQGYGSNFHPVVNEPQQHAQQAQPSQGMQLMVPPEAPPGCPPGLQYLTLVDQLLVKQKLEILEISLGVETGNHYDVINSMGQKVYSVAEKMRCEGCYGCLLCCCGPKACVGKCCACCNMQCCKNRSLSFIVKDNAGNRVMKMKRPLRCSCCLFPCCLQKMEIFAPGDTLIGIVKQTWGMCHPHYKICDAEGTTILKVNGPCCTWKGCGCCGGDVDFKVLALDGETVVGRVSKQWSGAVKEIFTDADNFGITFPMDLDAKCKASLLGACLLIDLMYFEDNAPRGK